MVEYDRSMQVETEMQILCDEPHSKKKIEAYAIREEPKETRNSTWDFQALVPQNIPLYECYVDSVTRVNTRKTRIVPPSHTD